MAPQQGNSQNAASANDQTVSEVSGQSSAVEDSSRPAEQFVQFEQFSTIGKMAASIVHDFKGPLTVIRGYAELLANPEINAEKRQRYSDMILEDRCQIAVPRLAQVFQHIGQG